MFFCPDDICFTTFSHDDADDVGEFVSHEGDDDGSDGVNYDNNVNCFTLIRAPVGKVVLLEFVEFALEENRECRYDAVELFEGLSHLDGPPFAKLCGHEVPRPFVSRGRELLVYFHSDESVTDAGFLARYEFVDARDGGGTCFIPMFVHPIPVHPIPVHPIRVHPIPVHPIVIVLDIKM